MHIRTFHEGLRFHCVVPDCTKTFTMKSKLGKHLKQHEMHPDKMEIFKGKIKNLQLSQFHN